MNNMLAVIFLPLVNFFLFLFLTPWIKTYTLGLRVLVSMSAAIVYLLTLIPSVINSKFSYVEFSFFWAETGVFQLDWAFSIDALSLTMLFVVFIVSTLVHLYSLEYMYEDPHLPRFMSYLSLFTFFMLILITSDNFVGLFLGWEGVGLCSYLLISFWFTRIQANKAAIQAMIVNRVADLTFTAGVLCIFYVFNSVNFDVVFAVVPFFQKSTISFFNLPVSPISLIAILLFFGAMGKSAQIGLHTWLPSAMEGPTPVSALIHAATMVTAGVFLIIRCSPLFEGTQTVLTFITFIGGATAFMAATAGLVQNDLKKVIAYSTCSQLGYMIFACGLSQYALSFFHLANHAFFKALLFLSAGAVIHSIAGEQDMRRFGSLATLLPYTYAMFLIGSLALTGFPFLTGFYSKDIILEIAAASFTLSGTFVYWLGLITAFFTSYYSFRLLYFAFYGESKSPRPYLLHVHEVENGMAWALCFLALGSIFLGYAAKDLFIGQGSPFWSSIIVAHASNKDAQLVGEFLPFYIKILPLFGSLFSIYLVSKINDYEDGHKVALHQYLPLYRFLSHKWYFDAVYNKEINIRLLAAAYSFVFKALDKGLIESWGPTGLSRIISQISIVILRDQKGRVQEYANTIILSITISILYMISY